MSEINYQELRVELGAAKKRIEELEANRVVLEVENERLKHAMAVALEHISVTDAGQAGVAAMIIYDAITTVKKLTPTLFWQNCGRRVWRWCANIQQSNFAL